MLMERNVEKLTRYLLAKGVKDKLKIQKLLFLMYVEEKISGCDFGYFKECENFECWAVGPISVRCLKISEETEKEIEEKVRNNKKYMKLLCTKQMKEIEKFYGKFFKKYKDYNHKELSEIIEKNRVWCGMKYSTYFKNEIVSENVEYVDSKEKIELLKEKIKNNWK